MVFVSLLFAVVNVIAVAVGLCSSESVDHHMSNSCKKIVLCFMKNQIPTPELHCCFILQGGALGKEAEES